MSKFTEGMAVVKSLSGAGVVTQENRVVHSVEDGVVYLEDEGGFRVNGITYDLHGREREKFFAGFSSSIEPGTCVESDDDD